MLKISSSFLLNNCTNESSSCSNAVDEKIIATTSNQVKVLYKKNYRKEPQKQYSSSSDDESMSEEDIITKMHRKLEDLKNLVMKQNYDERPSCSKNVRLHPTKEKPPHSKRPSVPQTRFACRNNTLREFRLMDTAHYLAQGEFAPREDGLKITPSREAVLSDVIWEESCRSRFPDIITNRQTRYHRKLHSRNELQKQIDNLLRNEECANDKTECNKINRGTQTADCAFSFVKLEAPIEIRSGGTTYLTDYICIPKVIVIPDEQ